MNCFPFRIAHVPAAALLLLLPLHGAAAEPWVVYEGGDGPGAGKHVVLVSGDEEYRSEEALPMLGKILAVRHGFKCTVLFAVNPDDGTIDPENQTNIPGLENLKSADLMIIATRFRDPPEEDMQIIDDYVQSGKPIIGLRTATHAFNIKRNKESKFAHYDFQSGQWKGGFGQQVLGDTWISHHGAHKKESTRGVVNEKQADHAILRGVEDVWGPTDVYGVKNLPQEADVLLYGQVLSGMQPSDEPVEGKKNDPMMPLAWTKTFVGKSGKPSRVFCTTMGSSTDFENEGLRRLVVNACYWCLGLEEQISGKSNVEIVGEYAPSPYGFGGFKKGVRPEEHELE